MGLYNITEKSKNQQYKNHNPYTHITGNIFCPVITDVKVNLSNAYQGSKRKQAEYRSVIMERSGKIQAKQGKKHARNAASGALQPGNQMEYAWDSNSC